ncbi:hypothetical protein [Branchiibius cervicis]|uniref:Uncharacterized protein n=1 Tax=Branchiibius cervicis TaxID=908252 RepID=A0ABW2ATG5_9MICO
MLASRTAVRHPAEHAGQLRDAFFTVDHGDIGLGDRAVRLFVHDQVSVGVRRDLRQVGDDDDLGRASQIR